MTYSIGKNYIRFSYPGGDGFQRINDDFNDLASNPKITNRMNVLVDLRSLPTTPKSEDMKKLAGRLDALNEKLGPKVSFVVKNSMEFGMIRVFGAYADLHGFKINIFETEETAISWLME